MSIYSRADLRPVFEAKPDMRFATTFLSNKYRDYAVNGESIMDKATGEIFTKRKEDGRVVSFFQNQKYLDALMLDLRILLTTHPEMRHPTDRTSFFLSTDYDVMTIHDNHDVNIVENNISIDNNAENPFNKLRFRVSNKSNGFFINLTTRSSDTVAIEYATGKYNSWLRNFVGTGDQFIEESLKFQQIEKWEDSNAILTYELVIKYRNSGELNTYEFTDYIRVNELSCVTFPPTINTNTLENAEVVLVKIKSIDFHKLHFLLDYKEYVPDFIQEFNKVIYFDNNIYLRYVTFGSFIDSVSSIDLLGNEFLVALADMPYVYKYMNKLKSLMADSSVLVSSTRPTEDVWSPNMMWAERLREVYKGGYEINFDTETDIHQLALYLAANDDTDYVSISLSADDGNDIYAERSDE